MLITPGHEAGRVYSSKAEPGAAEPQSKGLNQFRSEALHLPKADASVETPSLPLFTKSVTQLLYSVFRGGLCVHMLL